ncbi:MAG TPA: hypothetical protein VNY84_09290 [Acidimicrobiales bacterium]|jgi:Tol biopolymer transport system component|nr:hypothetical protein [Acidimicrobiales bacterium]
MKMTRHIVSVLCILSAAACSSGPARHVASTSAPRPSPERLVVVANSHLSVVDPTTGTSTDLPALGPAGYPAWSWSGQWLSYSSNGPLWVSRADGTQAHQVAPTAASSAWSPADDRLAVATDHGVLVVSPAGGSITLAPSCLVSSLAWSADGRKLAAVCDAHGHVDQLITTSADGETRGPSSVAVPKSVADGDTGLRMAGWWPDGLGLLVWIDPQHSASLAADGLSLVAVGLDAGARAHSLATTLGYPSWLSWSPDGHHLVVVEGSDRRTWTAKHLTVCDAHTGGCHPLAAAAGTVAIDPAWSPDGTRIAFVRAGDAPAVGGESAAWAASRQLWTAKPDGSDATRLAPDLTGVNGPRWSPDGTRLSVVAGDRVVVVDATSGATTPVGGLLSAADFDFYGTTDWSALLAWH